MNVERTLARVLWSFSQADGGASAIMRDLARNPLLTVAERQFSGVTLFRQEHEHAVMAAAWATKLGVSRFPGHDPYSACALRDVLVIRRVQDLTLRTAWTLAGLRWNEERSVRAFPRWVALMRRLGQPDMARDFTQLTDEERGHVAFGVRVAERLAGCRGFHAAYRHYYRLTAHAGVGILSAAFSGPLARLEAVAGR
jgi:hypothetical protein